MADALNSTVAPVIPFPQHHEEQFIRLCRSARAVTRRAQAIYDAHAPEPDTRPYVIYVDLIERRDAMLDRIRDERLETSASVKERALCEIACLESDEQPHKFDRPPNDPRAAACWRGLRAVVRIAENLECADMRVARAALADLVDNIAAVASAGF